jgi:uncharacterized membrane protein
LIGIGWLAGKLIGLRSVRNPWLYWWLGFFASSTVLMFFSLFFPVNIVSLAVFFAAGIIGLSLLYREYKQAFVWKKKTQIAVFIYILLLAVFSFLLAAPVKWTVAFDTALYHTQTVRWLNEYGTPPGLGNLHTRLAFNSSWLSFAALLDNGPWDNLSEYLLPALSWLGAVFYFLHEFLFTRKNGVRLYVLCILIWSLYYIAGIYPQLYYDDPVHIINAVVVLEAFYLFDNTPNQPVNEKMSNAAGVLMLSAGGFMIKPIGAVSLVFTGILVVFLLLQNKIPLTRWVKILCPTVFALAVWITRNILLSGYPLYPVPVLPLPLDWTMTYEDAKSNYDTVVFAARMGRMPGDGDHELLNNGFLFWFRPWLIRNFRLRNFHFLAALPSSFFLFFCFLVIRFARSKRALFFLIWSNLNILYWFLSAPDMRFGGGFFWVNFALSLLILFPSESNLNFSLLWKNKMTRWTLRYVWVLGIAAAIGGTAVSSKRSFFTIEPALTFPIKEYIVNTDAPFAVWIPLEEGESRTGNSPLPSAPGPVNIEMRKYGDLGRGFRPVI